MERERERDDPHLVSIHLSLQVTDLVDAHVKLIRVLKENEVFHYNVGNGKPYTVLEIVKVVEKVTKKRIIS